MNAQTITTPNFLVSTSKMLGFATSGAIAAFGIFVIMSKLAENNEAYVEPKTTVITADLLKAAEDKPTIERENKLPEPPKQMIKPPTPPQVALESDQIATGLNVRVDVEVPNVGISGKNFSGPPEGDATPIVRVEPKYPVKAARDGVEGWVSLSFSVDELGRVANVKVIEAQPKRYFEREAVKALKKWRYKPRIENGKAIVQHNQTVMLEFNMAGS